MSKTGQDTGSRDSFPTYRGNVVYCCIGCGAQYSLDEFLYTCPSCGSLLKLADLSFDTLKQTSGADWRRIFDRRRMSNVRSLSGIFLFHELILPTIEPEDVIYLGEGHTPLVQANDDLSRWVGAPFFVKNDGLNPSASFKDRGMASAISYLNYSIRKRGISQVLGICASTGDTSAAAALYLSYLPKGRVKSVVLLPKGKVTPQQLSQPLGSGATVIELPGVFDDCMRIVEELAEKHEVFLLNSKNPVRINGQKSYSYEVAQQLDWKTSGLVIVVPIGNAGNITAIMEGFLDLHRLGIIPSLPTIIGVQSEHADPVYRWSTTGKYEPVPVSPSVAQAAMIGDPVSFPKVRQLIEEHFDDRVFIVRVCEQEIMDAMLTANRHGHVVCTQGGESIAGLKKALDQGLTNGRRTFVVDSTSHQLKFAEFQRMYFEDAFAPEYQVAPKDALKNAPIALDGNAAAVADFLELKKKVVR
ncbi:MAG: threonine synthase [Deltaproteobacteria bacterium]|nr:threonine synthase [Deltaproteobacteria bacterium]